MTSGKRDVEEQLREQEDIDLSQELKAYAAAYESERSANALTVKTAFSFGWFCVLSKNKDDVKRGIVILRQLHDADERNIDYMYYLAVGQYRLGDYVAAQYWVDDLLRLEPNNRQARTLKGLIKDKIAKDGVIGMAIVGAVAAGVVAAGMLLFKRK